MGAVHDTPSNDPRPPEANLATGTLAQEYATAMGEQLSAAFTHAAMGLALVDLSGRFLRVNPRWCTVTGYTTEQLLARRFQDITHPDDLDADLELVDRLVRGEMDHYTLEKRYLRPDGSMIWANLTVSLVRGTGDGQPDYFVSVIEDISRRKALEERLRLQASMLERTHDAIFMWELGGPVVYWNRGAELLYGYSAEEVIGQISHDILDTRHYDTGEYLMPAAFEALVARTGDWTGEVEHVTRDRRRVTVLSRHQVLHGPDSRRYVLETSRDITDYKLLERQLQERAAELEAVNRRMDQFLGIANHELKTPLTGLTINLQTAARRLNAVVGQADGQEVAEPELRGHDVRALARMVDRSEQQVRRMTRLVNDLLDVSRMQAGKLELRVAPCDLAALVRECVEEQRQAAPNRAIQLSAPDGDSTIPVVADADRISQVVTNFLTNALKYSPPETPVEVCVSGADGQARVAVTDHGRGIPAGEQARIWNVFERLDDRESGQGTGVNLGLGLHISKMLVEQHHGAISVESAVGRGSTFWFALPVADA